jgi:hypothetical protein
VVTSPLPLVKFSAMCPWSPTTRRVVDSADHGVRVRAMRIFRDARNST